VSGSLDRRRWTPGVRSALLPIGRFVTVRAFLAVLGAIYLVAFISFGLQARGLIGSTGILPAADFFRAVREGMGRPAYRELPSLLWIRSTDAWIAGVWIAGAAASLVAISGRWQRTALAVCLVLWISLCSAGQDFLSFQWDLLLCEAGFLAIFAAPTRIVVWLFRWLLFRLMFFSGVVKLLSGDTNWRNLTALRYHYETQPLPTPPAWYMHQLPLSILKAQTAATFVIELLLPFLYFAPRPVRHIAGWITIVLQVLILATGNYTFFNFLTIALCMWLYIEPEVSRPAVLQVALAVFIGVTTFLLCLVQLNFPLPPGGGAVLHAVEPLRIVNSYGLFAVMTTERHEIVVEGSNDGAAWQVYEFKYKPGDPSRAPRFVEPFQPRLDWQMWFAALGSYQSNRWFVNFMARLLQGEPTVLRLLRTNPFPQAPPRYIRARLYLYHFTHWGARDWWTREERGLYFPPVSLRQ
jgi:lipase maturation factor 1